MRTGPAEMEAVRRRRNLRSLTGVTKDRAGYPGGRWDWQKWDRPAQRRTEAELIQHLKAIRPPAGLADQPLENMHPSKLAPSPPTLVQKQPFSPPPACLQRPAMKNFSK